MDSAMYAEPFSACSSLFALTVCVTIFTTVWIAGMKASG